MEYAPKGVGYAGMITGIIGTAGAVANAVTEIARGRGGPGPDPGDRPVTRYELGLIQESAAKDIKIAALEGRQYTDAKISEVKEFQAAQLAHNAESDAMTRQLQGQVMQLRGMFDLMIPGYRIVPGPTQPAASSGSTATTGSGTGA